MNRKRIKLLVEEISTAISGMVDTLPTPVAGSINVLCKKYKKVPYKKREKRV